MASEAGEHLILTIKEGTGILAPKTPQGFHDPTQDEDEVGYKVEIKFLDAAGGTSLGDVDAQDENFVVVKNPLSSTEPGATVRIDLATHANVTIGSNEEIAADFSGPSDDTHFILPSTISTSRIKIRPSGGAVAFDPADVLVQGEKVILTVPDARTVPAGDFVISFSQLARIKNPFVAGNRVITVSSFESGFRDDEITAVIRRSTTIDPSEGPRGTEFTLQGKGYQKGTVTIFEGDNRVVDAGETLTSVKTSKGAFSLKLNALGDYGMEKYTVHTIDSYGVYDFVDFDVTSSILFEPAVANVGSMLRMTIYDWEDLEKYIAAVRIAGQVAFIADVQRAGECFNHFGEIGADSNGTVILEVEVPDGVPPGEQTVSVYDREQLEYFQVVNGSEMEVDVSERCIDGAENGAIGSGSGTYRARIGGDPNPEATATIEIESEGLMVTPSTAARGQRVTITGSGFTRSPRGRDFLEVAIDGWPVPEDPSFFEVGTNGNFALTVTVPLEVRNGGVELRVEGWDHTVAQAELTIAEPSLTVDPAESGRGTKVNVSGSGFVAGRAVTLRYEDGVAFGSGDDIIGVAVADAGGGISATFKVPYSAAIGRIHKVTAVSLADDSLPFDLKAEADHVAVDAGVATMPVEVSQGDLMTVRGKNFPTFTLVGPLHLGGVGVVPRSETATAEDGAFEAEVLVPQLMLGDHVLRVQVGNEIAVHVIKIAPPPRSGPTGQVFKALIRQGVLARIWHVDSATQNWTFYDPNPEFSEFSTLTSVQSGDILFVQLLATYVFQGEHLVAAWNHIALK